VNTLVQLGYLRKDPNTKLISLGAQVMTLGASFYRTDDIYEVGKPLIQEAFETYQVNTELALYNEDMIVVVYRREVRESFVPRFPISRRNAFPYRAARSNFIVLLWEKPSCPLFRRMKC
jgi:DNA-binding IclR family transcriptional regulator